MYAAGSGSDPLGTGATIKTYSRHPTRDAAIGIAVVGTGYWGRNLIRNLVVSVDFDLLWLCDLEPRRASSFVDANSRVRVTADLADVLADPNVEGIVVATPAASHYKLALAALRAGKHVLVEKPLAASREAGRSLVEEADVLGLTLMCDHTYCYTPAVSHLRELVHSGGLGDLHYIDAVRTNLGVVRPDVDVLWDLAPHDLSILAHVMPEGVTPVSVSAVGSDPIGSGRCSIAYLAVQLSNGGIAHVQVSWLSPTKVRTVVIGGSRRTAVWDDSDAAYPLKIYNRGIDATSVPGQGKEIVVSHRNGEMLAPAIEEREALTGVVTEFARAIRTGTPALTDGRAGLAVLELLEAASRSLAVDGAPTTLVP